MAVTNGSTKKKASVSVVPVYLYQRAKLLKQSLAYFIVWIVSFALTLLV